MNLAAFRVRYPELVTASDELVIAKLAEAEANVDAGIYGDRYDQAHGLLAAHYVAISPGGQLARLVADDGSTTYQKAFVELRDAATTMIRVF